MEVIIFVRKFGEKNITFIYGSLIATDIIRFIIGNSYAFLFYLIQISFEMLPLCPISVFLFISLKCTKGKT